MKLQNICIVLARPKESGNIGSVCRAMANNGIACLRIVGKKKSFDENEIQKFALHAFSIWQRADFFSSITAACSDCTLAAGTTRRRGKKRKEKLFLPEELAELANPLSESDGKVALVFGNERTGLTDAELAECTIGSIIPSSEQFPSLNLSHAVQIFSYHFFRFTKKSEHGFSPLPLSRIEKTVSLLTDNLQTLGFFQKAGKPEMVRFWTSLLSRASLSESEAKYIEKIFTKISGLANAKNVRS